MEPMGGPSKLSPEFKERAIRMVREQRPQYPSQWATITSLAKKLGCTTETRWGGAEASLALRVVVDTIRRTGEAFGGRSARDQMLSVPISLSCRTCFVR